MRGILKKVRIEKALRTELSPEAETASVLRRAFRRSFPLPPVTARKDIFL